MASTKKTSQLDTLVNFLKQSDDFLLINFGKTKHIALEGLRKQLKTKGASLKVSKNTLLEKAFLRLNLSGLREKAFPLKASSALISLGKDWSEGLKTFATYAEKEQALSFKVGVLDKNIYLVSDLEKIAKLPPKLELIAKVIGGMKSPMSKLAYGLKFNMQKFVIVLNERSKKLS